MLHSRFYTAQLFYLLLFTQFAGMMRQAGIGKYIIFGIFLIPLLLSDHQSIRPKSLCILIPPAVFVLLGLVSCAASSFFNSFTLKTVLLLLFPAIFAIVLREKGSIEGIDICRTVFVGYLLYNILFFYSFHIAESTRSFPFGAFFIFFFLKKDWSFCLMAAALCVFTQKRIALLGMIAVLCLIIVVMALIKFSRIKMKTLWTAGSAIGIAVAYAIAGMTHTGKLIELFGLIGFDPTGRQTIWKAARPFGAFHVFYTGNGLGFVVSKLDEMRVWMRDSFWFTSLHSDFYVGLLELGFIGFGVWIASYFWSYNKLTEDSDDNPAIKLFAFCAIAYTFILYITDNTLVYFEYWFPLNLMLLDMAFSRTSDKKKQTILLESRHSHD